MLENPNSKLYDLEERTFQFSRNVALFCKTIPRNLSNIEYSKQLIRSSASIGANYIEANESLSKKDFLMRVKISRKESKESVYWLRLLIETNEESYMNEGRKLQAEGTELKKIFFSMLNNSK